MLYLFIIAFVGLVIVGINNFFLRRTLDSVETELVEHMVDAQYAYAALEEGADEAQTGYEQEYLSWADKEELYLAQIELLETEKASDKEEIIRLLKDLLRHDLRCLPDLTEMRKNYIP